MDPRYQCLGLGGGWSWRLLGSNHRALARASGTFASMEDATADALEVGLVAPSAAIEVLVGHGSTWRWELTVDDVPRAVSAVPYARRLECLRAVARFRECAPLAQVSAAPLIRRPGSGRALRRPLATGVRTIDVSRPGGGRPTGTPGPTPTTSGTPGGQGTPAGQGTPHQEGSPTESLRIDPAGH